MYVNVMFFICPQYIFNSFSAIIKAVFGEISSYWRRRSRRRQCGQTQGLTNYPQVAVGHLDNLQVGKPLAFDYPLQGQHSYLIRLGKAAVDGVWT